jgi:hypoxanthine phosphoribosyltransferase
MTRIDKNSYKITPLIPAEALEERIPALAQEIARQVGREITVISLLKGAFMFTADLIRALYEAGVSTEVVFITLSSYGDKAESSGEVKMLHGLLEDVQGKHVLVVDDILESGRTLQYACKLLEERGAASVKTAVLLEKSGKLAVNRQCDFIGFSIPDEFVVGYGLDYANYYRELPFIGILEKYNLRNGICV